MAASKSPRPSGILALRDHLLGPTLDHAVSHSTFWKRHLRGRAAHVDVIADLPRLPVTMRSQLVRAGHAIYAGSLRDDDRFLLSSGTTREGRQRLFVRQSRAELQAQAEYVALLQRESGPPARVLQFHNVAHGLPVGDPPIGETRIPWMPHPNMIELALHHLESARAARSPFTVIRGSVSAVLTLAVACRQRRVNARVWGVKFIGTNSYAPSPRVVAILQRVFGATVVDNYSLSELPAFASTCPACGALHWQHPPVVPELVDPETHRTIPLAPRATGMLVLTGLYPYVQRTPLIRYATGDVLSVTTWCDARGDWGWRFRGRARGTVSVPGLHVYAEDVYRVMDGVAGVARTPHPVEVLGVVAPGEMGHPRYRVRARPGGILVEVNAVEGHAREVVAQVKRRLPRAVPGLSSVRWRVVHAALPDALFKP